jgi:hypothetical protein
VFERVQLAVHEFWDARGPGDALWSPTAFGALAAPLLPGASLPDAAWDGSASLSVRDGVRKPSKLGGIIKRLDGARRLDPEGARRG